MLHVFQEHHIFCFYKLLTNSFLSQAAKILGCYYTTLAWVKGKRPQEAETDFFSVVY